MTFPPDRPVRMTILSEPEHLPLVRAVTEKMCNLMGFEDETTGNVVLSVDEALTNIIKHAYEGEGGKPIEIELIPTGGRQRQELRIVLRDYGRYVDRGKIKSRDLADVRPGGLGIHIMTECMDRVEYRAAEGGGTVLTMVRRLSVHQRSNAK